MFFRGAIASTELLERLRPAKFRVFEIDTETKDPGHDTWIVVTDKSWEPAFGEIPPLPIADSIISFCALRKLDDENVLIYCFGVDIHLQRKGYGTAMMNYILKNYPTYVFHLAVELLNLDVVKFYRKFGFEEENEPHNLLDRTEEQVWFVRPKSD